MQIIVNTIQGTFVVPPHQEAALISWLQNNAVKVDRRTPVREQDNNETYTGQQLLVD